MSFCKGVAGSASYTVFATDYDTFGAIFTCQKLAFANRQSATILSRKKTLDKMYLDKVSPSQLQGSTPIFSYFILQINQSHRQYKYIQKGAF